MNKSNIKFKDDLQDREVLVGSKLVMNFDKDILKVGAGVLLHHRDYGSRIIFNYLPPVVAIVKACNGQLLSLVYYSEEGKQLEQLCTIEDYYDGNFKLQIINAIPTGGM